MTIDNAQTFKFGLAAAAAALYASQAFGAIDCNERPATRELEFGYPDRSEFADAYFMFCPDPDKIWDLEQPPRGQPAPDPVQRENESDPPAPCP